MCSPLPLGQRQEGQRSGMLLKPLLSMECLAAVKGVWNESSLSSSLRVDGVAAEPC